MCHSLTLMHVDERIQQIDEVAEVVQGVPHRRSTFVDLPEDRPADHKNNIIKHRQRNNSQPLHSKKKFYIHINERKYFHNVVQAFNCPFVKLLQELLLSLYIQGKKTISKEQFLN